MPTQLPDLTSEFLGRYNRQQRELQSSGHTAPAEREIDELNRQLAVIQQLQTDHNVLNAEVAKLRRELADSKRALLAEEERARLAAEEVATAQQKLKERLKAAPKTSDRRELTDLKVKLKALEDEILASKKTIDEQQRTIANLKQRPGPVPPEPARSVSPVNAAALTRKLNEVRQKLSEYSKRLGSMSEFEFSVTSRLTSEQRRELVEALSKELAGKMERYQALSLWEKAGDTEGGMK